MELAWHCSELTVGLRIRLNINVIISLRHQAWLNLLIAERILLILASNESWSSSWSMTSLSSLPHLIGQLSVFDLLGHWSARLIILIIDNQNGVVFFHFP
jgi:hypothetical protein